MKAPKKLTKKEKKNQLNIYITKCKTDDQCKLDA